MKLQEFCTRFGQLSDEAFLANFKHPFLLEEGRLALEEGDPSDRSVFQLRTGEATKIGRGKAADVRVVHEQVSNRHAVIWPPEKEGGGWGLMDMNSTNGTFLEGKKLPAGERAQLQPGTVIRFGQEVRLAFVSPAEMLKVVRRQRAGGDAAGGRSGDPLAATTDYHLPVIRPDEPHGGAGSSRDATRMLLVCEPFDPVPLEPGKPVIVGRSPRTAQLVLPDSQVSREHCEVVRKPEGVFVRDLRSANGTFVCQVRVSDEPMELLPGKAITIGPFRVLLDVPGVSASDMGATRMVPVGKLQASAVEGSLESLSLETLLTDIEGSQRTGVLTVESGSLRGRIAFKAGEPQNASLSTGERDLAAIKRLLGLTTGRFSLSSQEGDLGARSIKLSVAEILLDLLLQEGG